VLAAFALLVVANRTRKSFRSCDFAHNAAPRLERKDLQTTGLCRLLARSQVSQPIPLIGSAGRSILLVLSVVLVLGCAGIPMQAAVDGSYDYFAVPDEGDPFEPPAVEERALRSKYANFRAERRRGVARDFAEWIQSEAKQHYVADGPIDHWATLEETLRSDGDDCDGLELLVFHGLRDLGFAQHEVFRAVVVRPDDGQHHMVTLWFEDRDDPWVIDPTGAMTSGLRRMSDIPGWVPLKIFSDDREFSARSTVRDGALAAR
jgi:hypothetical protein